MLRERIITALALLVLLVPAAMAVSAWPFALVTLVFIAAAGWEWARLCGMGPVGSAFAGMALGTVCAAVGPVDSFQWLPPASWWTITALWILGGGFVLHRGPANYQRLNRWVRLLGGGLLLGAAWSALVAAKARGLPFLASVCALVWCADIAAYFGGRAWGRRKLAPTVSPGKSWEGAWSGGAAVLLLALAVAAAVPEGSNLFSLLRQRWGWVPMLLSCGALVALAIVGDLCESLVKRAAGVKDSSCLLPGHGGVLDRIDALLPVFPAALALTMAL